MPGIAACVPRLRKTRQARPTVIQLHLKGFRRHETPFPHDQLGATRLVALQVHLDEAFDHGTLALPNFGHIDRDGTRRHPELRGMMHQICDLSAPDLVLAGETVDVRAGAADSTALYKASTLPKLRHVPG